MVIKISDCFHLGNSFPLFPSLSHLPVIASCRKGDEAMATTTLHGSLHFPRDRVAAVAGIARARLASAWRNFTTRRELMEMDDRMLKDLGISRAQAHFEANRPIWR